ncbi:MAG TPA: hypothetical protein VHW92_05455 [Mycobacteriales bacterium]|jgi:hypothetical protein|nr:hypothetical protein [Mycobacteriales bacterium]
MSEGFDRVRPRTPRPPSAVGPTPPDAEGKRALFSSAAPSTRSGAGSVLVECSRCGESTALGLAQALRAAWPSLHLALRLGHAEDVTVLGLSRRDYPTFMRCPSCGRPSWVRFTLQV